MPTPIEQALTSLLPTINVISPELTSLANSILIQSRSKAPQLKAEEEIGRIYACADIACDRLKSRLHLDRSHPARPPCQPRVYKKLLTFLQGVLALGSQPSTPTKTGTPRIARSRQTPTSTLSARTKDVDESPSVRTLTARKRKLSELERDKSPTPTSSTKAPHDSEDVSTPSKKRASGRNTNDKVTLGVISGTEDHPPFSLPASTEILLASLAKSFSHGPKVVSHLRNGLNHVLSIRKYNPSLIPSSNPIDKEGGRGESDVMTPSLLPASMIVLMLYINAKIVGKTIDEKEFVAQRDRAVECVEAVLKLDNRPLTNRNDVEGGDGEGGGDGDLVSSIQEFLRAAVKEGWLQGEWFEAVKEGDGIENEVEMADGGGNDDDQGMEGVERDVVRKKQRVTVRNKNKMYDDQDNAAGLLPGLRTMFQDAVDWLSYDKKEEYKVWEREMMKKLHHVLGEQNQGGISKAGSRMSKNIGRRSQVITG